jgi:hypothetical protein
MTADMQILTPSFPVGQLGAGLDQRRIRHVARLCLHVESVLLRIGEGVTGVREELVEREGHEEEDGEDDGEVLEAGEEGLRARSVTENTCGSDVVPFGQFRVPAADGRRVPETIWAKYHSPSAVSASRNVVRKKTSREARNKMAVNRPGSLAAIDVLREREMQTARRIKKAKKDAV